MLSAGSRKIPTESPVLIHIMTAARAPTFAVTRISKYNAGPGIIYSTVHSYVHSNDFITSACCITEHKRDPKLAALRKFQIISQNT
jgi:hypothetical protein